MVEVVLENLKGVIQEWPTCLYGIEKEVSRGNIQGVLKK
jgi:hypothetical protein